MKPFRWRLWLLGSLFVGLLAPRVLAAATPRDELLRLVPGDVGFCLAVQDLRGHVSALLGSPFADQFRKSAFGAALENAPEIDKLRAVEERLHISWKQVRDDLLGDAVVLAYRPGPPGKPDQEQGLVLLRARDARLLADVIERLNEAQKQSGELKELEERDHNGRKYYRRVDNKKVDFYYVSGPVLAFTGQEAILLEAIERDRAPRTQEESPVARQFRLLGVDRQLAALWINPRAFQAHVEHKAAAATGDEAAVLGAFLRYWKALDGIALSLALDRDVDVALSLRVDNEKLPAAARRLFARAAERSALWKQVPEDALFAVAGRLDAGALFEMFEDFLTPEKRQALRVGLDHVVAAGLGQDLVKEVLPALGPDWGFYVAAPAPSEAGWLPHAVFALRVQPGEGGASIDRSLLTALQSFAFLAVLGHNDQHADKLALKTEVQDNAELRYIVSDAGFPPGLRPAFTLRAGYLLFASCPEAILRFGNSQAAGAPHADSGDVPLLRVSFKAVRQFLADRHDALARAVAAKNQISFEEAGRRLDKLALGLELVDRMDVSQGFTEGRATVKVRVKMAQPLK